MLFFRTRRARIWLSVVLLLVAMRIALPYVMLYYANKKLASMDGYYGHIDDIDVALYRGAYMIDQFYLNKVDDKNGAQTDFMGARRIDLAIEWRALFKGRIAGTIIFEEALLVFTEDKVELSDVSKDTSDFRELLRDFMPVDINTCEIRDGKLLYIDKTRTPNIDLAITNLDGIAENLRNVYKKSEVLPSTITATGSVYQGRMNLAMKLNPLAQEPTFDLNSKIEQMQLTGMNEMFKAYGGFDVNKGTFSMYTEIAAKKGQFTGYVKPLLNDVDVVSWKGQDKQDGFFQKIWESIVGGGAEIFENQKKDQFATKINFGGPMDNPRVNTMQAVVTVLQNAFIRSLQPSIDNQINLSDISKENEKKGFFKALFDNDEQKAEAKKNNKVEKESTKKADKKAERQKNK